MRATSSSAREALACDVVHATVHKRWKAPLEKHVNSYLRIYAPGKKFSLLKYRYFPATEVTDKPAMNFPFDMHELRTDMNKFTELRIDRGGTEPVTVNNEVFSCPCERMIEWHLIALEAKSRRPSMPDKGEGENFKGRGHYLFIVTPQPVNNL